MKRVCRGLRAGQKGGTDLDPGSAEHQRRGQAPSVGDPTRGDDRDVDCVDHLWHQRKSADRSVVTVDQKAAAVPPGFGTLGERDYVDEFGFHIHDDAWEKTSWIVQRPFDDEAGAAEYLKKLVDSLARETRGINANPRAHREQFLSWWWPMQKRIGGTVHLLAEQGTGLDDIRAKLGLEIFSYLDADNPGIIDEACEAWTVRNLAHCHAIADPALSPAVLTYCDIAYKGRLIHSPEYLRGHLFPQLKRLNDAWHEHGLKCLFHSDGYLMEVMDDLVAAGIDGLNPIETVAGMDLREVRRKYPKIFLAGGIDMSQLLSRGTPEQVKEVCRQAIRDACPGYLMGSTTEADNSCKPENLVAMYEVAREGL